MENNDLSNSEKLYIKVDQNNLIYIDPNSVVVDNTIQPRSINQEKLVMYVNLEADLIPRSRLTINDQENTLTFIAKGTFNMLRSQSDDDKNLTTDWTTSFTTEKDSKTINDSTGQSFGITSINIDVKGASFVPQVNMTFIDVRGKTLFESPETSPYRSFFHIPWPIFYLTVKGYYGKAIRYRLHLVKLNTSYNSSTGNFETSARFVGSTFAFMNDIPLKGILNAPYMFVKSATGQEKLNEETGLIDVKVFKSSKGYSILKSVYDEMKIKKYIPENFPVITLRELGHIAGRLDLILEKKIHDEVADPKLISVFKEYGEEIAELKKGIIAWRDLNLSNRDFEVINSITYYRTKSGNVSVQGENINGSLEIFLNRFSIKQEIIIDTFNRLNDKKTLDIQLLSKKLNPLGSYYFNEDYEAVAIDKLLEDIDEILKNYREQDENFNKIVEEKINTIIKNPINGFGFDPTVRNLFAVLLANAEVFVRLMGDVHERAFNVGQERKKYVIGNRHSETKGEAIYPWPEIKKKSQNTNDEIIAYPAEEELIGELLSNNAELWPEVEFVEEFLKISTNIADPLVEKEPGVNEINYIFVNDFEESKINDVSTIFLTSDTIPYINRTVASFVYEIYERAKILTLVDSFSVSTLKSLADAEFDSINNVLKNEYDIKRTLKNQINSVQSLKEMLFKVSPYERYEFYKEKLPTTEYIKNYSISSTRFEQFQKNLNNKKNEEFYNPIIEELKNFKSESYRSNIYPFNSDLYLSYINKRNTDGELNIQGVITLNQNLGYLTSPFKFDQWVKDDYVLFSESSNLFTQKIKISENFSTNILNTPYFHKQLYFDYQNTQNYGRYRGSAYLLVNSLPFFDLNDNITVKNSNNVNVNIRMSSLFKEIGATHFIPYLLIVKWGSLYHRYKNFIENDEDILDGFLNNNVTTNIDSNLFFNNNETDSQFTGFTINGKTVTYSGSRDIGVHPFYDAIFHDVVNGNTHYNVDEGNESFSGKTSDGSIIYNLKDFGNVRYWAGVTDNSKYGDGDFYTLLPSEGKNTLSNKKLNIPENILLSTIIELNNDSFEEKLQSNYRLIWDDEYNVTSFSGKTFASPYEYNLTYDEENKLLKEYSIGENYRKVIDLIGTFSPQILDNFESIFLDFSSTVLNTESSLNLYSGVKYNSFQGLLKEIVTVNKIDSTDTEDLFNKIKKAQSVKLRTLTYELANDNEFLKVTIGNPKELDSYIFESFYNNSGLTFNTYNVSQLANEKYIKLYVGENPDTAINYYTEFFQINNIELSQENVIVLRSLILIYAGYRKSGGTASSSDFKNFIKLNIFDKNEANDKGANYRLEFFLTTLINNFSKLSDEESNGNINFIKGYNLDVLKLETYNFLKSFNDKWSAGNSIGQRLLMDEFLFLNRANVDIGDKVYLNIDRFTSILSEKNEKSNLYGAISMLIQDTGFDMRALPSYVNFYAPTINSNKMIPQPSQNTASNIFGTFLEVDYQESSPKIIIQFVGTSSKRLADLNTKEFKYTDDSFNIGNTDNNPIIITLPEVFRDDVLSKSNKAVAFEVNVGDQYQGIFKAVSLDQSTIRNNSESFVVTENIARSESGSGTYNVDIALFEYYRQASYYCEVTCMGNVMIQPTMFFYLKNVPMFRGTYWITEVSHDIHDNMIETKFKGSRIPKANLPNLEDSFTASYRPLLEKVISNSLQIARTIPATTDTEEAFQYQGNNYIINRGDVIIPFEQFLKNQVGLYEGIIPINGFRDSKYIQRVKYKNEEWLRAYVVRMGGLQYPIAGSTDMSIISSFSDITANPSKITWDMIDQLSSTQNFYSTKFIFENNIKPDILIGKQTVFLNPNLDEPEKITIVHNYSLDLEEGINISGPINSGPSKTSKAGIGMSYALMKRLNIFDNQVVYFKILGI